MRYSINILSLLLLGMLLSCSEEVEPSLGNYVVEGYLIANEPVYNIRVKTISPIVSDSILSDPITDAQVILTHEGESFPLDYNPETELFEYSDPNFLIESQREYGLEVRANNRTSTSVTTAPDMPTGARLSDDQLVIPELTLNLNLGEQIGQLFEEERILFSWDSRPGQFYFVVIENRAETLQPILPDGIPPEATELLSSFRFISEPSEETTFDIIGVALETYGPHVAKVYSVNQEYVDLFENLEQDSRDLNEPPTNISNALGIFTAFAVDSVAFEVVME